MSECTKVTRLLTFSSFGIYLLTLLCLSNLWFLYFLNLKMKFSYVNGNFWLVISSELLPTENIIFREGLRISAERF